MSPLTQGLNYRSACDVGIQLKLLTMYLVFKDSCPPLVIFTSQEVFSAVFHPSGPNVVAIIIKIVMYYDRKKTNK